MPRKSSISSQSIASTGRSPRIALIGCGAIAEGYYMPALARHRRILESMLLVDHNFSRARHLAARFRIKQCFADHRAVLDTVDGAIIALPTPLHHSISLEFLSRRIPVLCEKPLADSTAKALEMIELAHKMEVALAANYQQRLWPQFVKVKELILDRSLGEPVRIKYQAGDKFTWPTVSGFQFNSAGGRHGILLDRGAHVLDHICWWLGDKPKLIVSQNDSFGGIDAVAYARFEHNKCVGEVKLSWLSNYPGRFLVEFELGSIQGEIYYPQSVLLKMGAGPQKRVKLKAETYKTLGHRMVDNFIDVIVGRETPLVPATSVLDSIKLTDDCYAAATRFHMPWYSIFEAINDQ